MSLLRKLEGDNLQRLCQNEVEELHQLFVSWFQGKEEKAVLQSELTARLQSGFTHIAPNGQFLSGRDNLIAHLDDKYGCYHDRIFSIDIYSVKLLWQDVDSCLCTYEEWQKWQQDDAKDVHQFGRLSTCLLVKKNNIWQWVHVHETWLEAEAPSHPSPPTRKLIDDETIMTGPVEATKIPRMQKEMPVVVDPRDETDDDVSGQKQLLVLISSQSLSREQTQFQDNALNALTDHHIPYQTVDGADASQRERRNQLFGISKVWGKYPQFFIVQDDNSTISWGGREKFQESIDAGSLTEDLGITFYAKSSKEEMDSLTGADEPQTIASTLELSENQNEEESNNKKSSVTAAPTLTISSDSHSGSNADNAALGANGNGKDSATISSTASVPLKKAEIISTDPEGEAERTFLEASHGILFFEEENDDTPPIESPSLDSVGRDQEDNIDTKTLQTPPDASTKRHVSPKLEKYAKPLTWDNTLIGISVSGFDIGTSQGPIADEGWYNDVGLELENLAQSRSIPRPRRRLALPEMVFPTAHVALEGHGVWLSWDAVDALREWAEAHHEIAIHSSIGNCGVSVLKAKDAKLWDKKVERGGNATEKTPSVFHYDWTYSTPFCGTMEGGEWQELEESGMRVDLLTDQSVPILFFDEIVLFEDDLHDNGQSQYTVKLRVMPSCAYVLARLWVRVDNVVLRLREIRVLIDFFGIKPQIYRDVTWRECWWDALEDHGLPVDVRSWHFDGRETPTWHAQLQKIPEVDLPKGLLKYAVLEQGFTH